MTVDGWGWIKWKILKGACGRIRRGIYDIDVTVALNKTFSLNFRCGNSVAVYLFFPLRRRHFPNFCAIAQISNTKEAKESIQVTPRFVITTRLTNKNQTTKCIVLLRLSRLLFLLGFCWFISVSLNFFFRYAQGSGQGRQGQNSPMPIGLLFAYVNREREGKMGHWKSSEFLRKFF